MRATYRYLPDDTRVHLACAPGAGSPRAVRLHQVAVFTAPAPGRPDGRPAVVAAVSADDLRARMPDKTRSGSDGSGGNDGSDGNDGSGGSDGEDGAAVVVETSLGDAKHLANHLMRLPLCVFIGEALDGGCELYYSREAEAPPPRFRKAGPNALRSDPRG